MKARLIRVQVQQSDTRHFATSVDLPGLFASEATAERLREVLPEVIQMLLEADGDPVLVQEVENADEEVPPYVAIPVPELVALGNRR